MSAEERVQRNLELQRKKEQLARIKEERRRQDELRKQALLSPNKAEQNGSGSPSGASVKRVTLSSAELETLLIGCGISSEPSLPSNNGTSSGSNSATTLTIPTENGVEAQPTAPLVQTVTSSSRVVNLELTAPKGISIPQKDVAVYCKTTQTDDEKFSVGEFSLGSQEFDYDDDMLPSHKHAMDDFDSPTDDLAKLLPGFSFGRQTQESEKKEVEEEKPKLPDLSDQEKVQVMSSPAFQTFFDHASRIIERALAENVNIFVDYAVDSDAKETYTGERLTLRRTFSDPKWTEGREVVAISFCEQHPELFAVAYDMNPEKPGEPAGVVAVFNTKFKKDSAEFIFHAQARLTAVAFARFHTNLLLAGCYTGQICMWDNRVLSKKTPINKSPLSQTTHTQPIFSLRVIGSHNAHNLVSISNDGKMCSWNVDNLAQPVDTKDLYVRGGSKQIPVVCMAFPSTEFNNFVIGSEDGNIFAISRHGTTATGQAVEHQLFDGHSAPISSVCFHRATSATSSVDFSHLFLSSSCDWAVRLWSCKDPLLRYSFENHSEYVYDVQWSPVHPAVFCTLDTDGNLFVWNLNEDIEGPVARMQIERDNPLAQGRKLAFSANGQFVVTGDNLGTINIFELHENYYANVKNEEWGRFARVLADIKAAREEAEELSETMSRLGGAVPSGNPIGSASAVAVLTAGGASPRQNWN